MSWSQRDRDGMWHKNDTELDEMSEMDHASTVLCGVYWSGAPGHLV
jgi:hypothetical protein